MRPPIDNITTLQKQINDLQLENQILKHILQRSGISYVQELKRMRESGDAEGYDSNQGARIIYPKQITEEMANLFTPGSGDGRMFMPKEVRRKARERRDIIRSVTIFGKRSVQKSIVRK